MAQVAPAEVADECMRQMALGICRVAVDRSMLTPGQTVIISGAGRVAMSAMADYTDLYNPKVSTDSAMCDLALHYMTEQPGGDHDKIARAFWTPTVEKKKKRTRLDLLLVGLALIAITSATTIYLKIIKYNNRKYRK